MGQLRNKANNYTAIGTETIPGTMVPVTAKLRVKDNQSGKKLDKIESQSLTGQRGRYGMYTVTSSGFANIPVEADSENMGFFLKGALGSETVTLVAGSEYKHVFSMLNGPQLPTFTLENGKGGYRVYRYPGSVVNQLQLTAAPKAIVEVTASFLSTDEVDTAFPLIPANVAIATDIITATNHGLIDGNMVRFFRNGASSVLPAGLVEGTDYYVVSSTTSTLKVSLTSGGTAVDITGAGTGYFDMIQQSILAVNANRPFIYNDGVITIDGTACGEIKQLELTLNNNLFADDFRMNLAGKLASLPAGALVVTGSVVILWNSDSDFLRQKYLNGAACNIQLTLTTTTPIPGGTFEKLTIKLPNTSLSSGEISGDQLQIQAAFEAFLSSGSPATIELNNARATVY